MPRFLGPHKTVRQPPPRSIRSSREMGPVDAAGGSRAHSGAAARRAGPRPSDLAHVGRRAAPPVSDPRRLDAQPASATGIAAYFHVDVTIVRIIFMVLTLLSPGRLRSSSYLVLAFVIPSADTVGRACGGARPAVQRAGSDRSRQGAVPRLQGQERLAPGVAADRQKFKQEWRQGRQQWKEQWRQQKRQWREQWYGYRASDLPPLGYGTQVLAGVMVPLLAIFSAICFWLWIYALVSLSTSRQVFGLAAAGRHAALDGAGGAGLRVSVRRLAAPCRAPRIVLRARRAASRRRRGVRRA